MTRPVNLIYLVPIRNIVKPEETDWPAQVQAAIDALYPTLTAPDQLSDSQYAALASLTQSVGAASINGSTIWRFINAGNYVLATYEFEKWVYRPDPVTGDPVVDPGLVNRRLGEKALWLL